MFLLSLPAFLTRRREDNPMPEITTPAETQTDVVMRFRTQGGAVVELHRQDYRLRTAPGDIRLLPDGETRISHGFNWRCVGCDAIGGRGRYGLNERHFDEHFPDKSRDQANQHAAACRAMPKPEA